MNITELVVRHQLVYVDGNPNPHAHPDIKVPVTGGFANFTIPLDANPTNATPLIADEISIFGSATAAKQPLGFWTFDYCEVKPAPSRSLHPIALPPQKFPAK